ncbi:hypothetical protein [Parasaccharibacter apium]|uniref:hypothetical protein n=1 Tax=Parasaccharibacter apium TaxID=1510841 RepID=UPI0011AF0F6E|nr:hypothetical protein [Parasaccharibacter apium]QGT74459.1 hypothetical protein GN304_00745 [Bombella sp. ESL0368]
MNQITLADKAIPLQAEMTLGLVIASGDVSTQQNVTVQVDDTFLPDCPIISHDGHMVIALLPRKQAEACIDPLAASAVSIPALGITEAEIDWVGFPANRQPQTASQILQMASETEEEQSQQQAAFSPPPAAPPEAVPFPPPDATATQHPADGTPEDKKPEDAPETTQAMDKTPSSSRKKGLLIPAGGAVIALCLATAGGWFWFHKPSFLATPAYQNMSPADAVKQLVTPAAIGQEGWRRIRAGQGDAGLRLLGYAATKHDPVSLQRMGELYDPARFRTDGPIPQPNPREAARYYREALLAGNQDVRSERDSLLAALRKKAENGDQEAAFTLQEYAR